MRVLGRGVVVVGVVFVFVLCLVPAVAFGARPGWGVMGRFGPTDLQPGGTGKLVLYVYDVGGEPGSGAVVRNVLPAGVELDGTAAGCRSVSVSVLLCETGEIETNGEPDIVKIPVKIASGASDGPGEVDVVTVEGGGALETARVSIPAHFSSVPAEVGFSGFDGWVSTSEGTADTQVGSHPYEFTVAYSVNSVSLDEGQEEEVAGGEAHDLNVNLPPGFVGEPTAVPQCKRRQIDGEETGRTLAEECPPDSQVGMDYASLNGNGFVPFALYNMVPPPGVAAQFGFSFNGITVLLDAGVRSGGDNGITEHADHVPQRKVIFNTATIWGVPGEHGTGAESRPLLTLPTSCGGGPPVFGIEMLGTWQDESVRREASFLFHNDAGEPVELTGCDRLVHFEPSLTIQPETGSTDSATGLTGTVHLPQGGNPEGLATSGLKEARVVLPEGLVINPGQANGLVACGETEEGFGLAANGEVNEGPPSCPLASKIGSDEIVTPLLPGKLEGNVYVLQSNPPHVKILVAASGFGVNLKLVGDVELNPVTGRVETIFRDLPDAPFSEFKLRFSGGAQAALVTPTECHGDPLSEPFSSSAVFSPWSGLEAAVSLTSFVLDSGPGGAGCVSPLPFGPVLSAGSTTDQAAGYTGFSMLLSRGDGQQRVSALQFRLPRGLLGMISHVPLCGEPQAASGSCPEASKIGSTVTTAGPGPDPLVVPGPGDPPAPIYLTGPYDGAPFGLSIAVPVIAGPFDLGTVVVRARIEVDPHTAQVTITTSDLPTILGGVPTDLRSIYADISRSEFMVNPTDCDAMLFEGVAVSTQGARASLSSPFRVGSCRSLSFTPGFKVSTSGKPSRADGASLSTEIVYPSTPAGSGQESSESNIARVKVSLPKQLPSRLTTLQKACPAAVFDANPAGCPEGSIVGSASTVTPVLSSALSGPAYFVSHGNEAFPSLVLVLQGQGITVDLEGTTFISKQGITTTTFPSVPDVPFSSFTLSLPQGPHSALAANGNLCKDTLGMPTEFVAQDGAVIKQTTKITVTGCPKKKHTKTKKAKKAKKDGRAGKAKGSGGRKR